MCDSPILVSIRYARRRSCCLPDHGPIGAAGNHSRIFQKVSSFPLPKWHDHIVPPSSVTVFNTFFLKNLELRIQKISEPSVR